MADALDRLKQGLSKFAVSPEDLGEEVSINIYQLSPCPVDGPVPDEGVPAESRVQLKVSPASCVQPPTPASKFSL